MRRIGLILVCGFAVLGVIAFTMGTASAATFTAYTNYHYKTALMCNDCHTMHGIAYAGSTTKLLKIASGGVSDACLTCHLGSGGSAPDVKGGVSGGQATPRSAGALTDATAANGHTVTDASATPPGGSAITTFKCTSCHANHGNTNYRNLVANPGTGSGLNVVAMLVNSLTDSVSTVTADVLIEVGGTAKPPYSTGPGDFYNATKIYHIKGNITPANAYAMWCEGCHTGFEVNAPGGGKHPTGTNLGTTATPLSGTEEERYVAASVRVPALVSVFDATTAGKPSATGVIQPTCASCHKAHGNGIAYGLLNMVYQTSGGTLTEDGMASGTLEGTCQICHTQGT